ncbi:MAG: stage III sporulation protein AB [Clostridia bacterium]|nr:stage III sporulation protein AB [Clostridia bacterium]
MKYTGIGLVAVSLTLTGLFSARMLKIRLNTVNSVLLFISLLQNEMSFTLSPIADAVENAGKSPSLYLLDFPCACAEMTKQGMDFPDAWKTALEESPVLLKKQERNQIIQMGQSLSRCDAKGQERIFDYYRAYFTEIFQKAGENRKKYASVLSAAGILLSALAAVILI